MILDVVLNSLMTSELPEHYNKRRRDLFKTTLVDFYPLVLFTSFDTAAMEEFNAL